MTDIRIRDLERRAAAGEEGAAEELRAELRRAGQGCLECGQPHPPLCPPGQLDRESAIRHAQNTAEGRHPFREGRSPGATTQIRNRALKERERTEADQLRWMEQVTSEPHRFGSLMACRGCRAFLMSHQLPRGSTWRDRAARLVAIARITLPRGASKKQTQAHLALYRLETPGGASWLNRMWQEEVRKVFPQLARKKVRALAHDDGGTPLFGGPA